MLPKPSYPTPIQKLSHWSRTTPNRIFLRQPINGKTTTFTWSQVDDQARKLASAFLAMGLQKGDRVAIIAKNCAHWFITDYAIQMAGLVSVPLFPDQSSDSIHYILKHSEAKAIMIGKLEDANSLEAGLTENIIRMAMPNSCGVEVDYHWQELMNRHFPLEELAANDAQSLMTIIYTSGTTGNPKGVMQTYGSFGFAAQSLCEKLNYNQKDRFLSFLPLSHAAERFLVLAAATYSGAQVFFVESLDTFSDNLKAARPTIFFAVPRLWQKFQQKVSAQLSEKKLNTLVRIPLLKTLIQKKVQKALGLDCARIIISGSAPISFELLAWYKKVGLEINEGYAMTECMSYGPTFNLPGMVKLGTVGHVSSLPHCKVKITQEGEVAFQSPSLMQGYYLEPEKTKEVLRDNWYHTGDRGVIDSEGFLSITGRMKDVFKTSKGKFVQPNNIENKLMANEFFEQVCVAGSGEAQPFALIELSQEAKASLPGSIEEIENSIKTTLKETNAKLDHHEVVERIFIIEDSWTPDNAMLTPTLKIKRHEIEKHYAALTKRYSDSQVAFVWQENSLAA